MKVLYCQYDTPPEKVFEWNLDSQLDRYGRLLHRYTSYALTNTIHMYLP